MKINLYSLGLLISFWLPATSFTMKSHSLRDLEYNSTAFGSEVALWENSQSITTLGYTFCGGTPLVGGYMGSSAGDVERIYSGLPSHNSVFISLKIWMIDDWNPGNPFIVDFDDVVFSFSAVYNGTSSTVNVCGQAAQNDLAPVELLYKADHSSSSFYINIWGWNQSSMYGFREINIMFSNHIVIESSYCGITQPEGLLESSANCLCPTQKYWNTTTQKCEWCDVSCDNCFGPTSADCYSCGNQYSYDGMNCVLCDSISECTPCSTGNYTHSNSICKDYCDPPYNQSTWNGVTYCNFPCQIGTYLYANGTCTENCEYPFILRFDGLDGFCDFRCSSGSFLYPNNCCKSQCPSIFQKVQGVEAYCTFPCNSSQYYYLNGSCLSTCSSPFSSREDALNNFCDFSCSSGSFLYSNSSCRNTCSYPYIPQIQGVESYCYFPCTSQTFLWSNGSCFPNCEFPMVIWNDSLSYQFCKEPCENKNFFYYQISKLCKPSCPDPYQINLTTYYKSCKDTSETALIKGVTAITSVTGTATTVGLQVANTASSGSPGGLAIGVIIKMFSYVKYLDLGYSLELQEALKTWKSNIIPFNTAPDMPETLKEENATLPSIFTKYDVFPRFLANFWQDLFFLLLLLGICVMFRLLEWLAPKVKKKYFPESLFCGLRTLFQNFLLALLYGSYGDILLYSMLDFNSNDFATIVSILSFLISAAFVLFTVLFLLFHFWLLCKYQRMRIEAVKKRKFEKLESFIESQKGVQVIFREFKDGSFSQQAFLLFFTLRDLLFSLVLTFFYPYPLIQAIIINILSVAMLIYLFIVKPFKEEFDFVQQIFCELAILIINIIVLITAIEDALGNGADEIRTFLGKLAIYLNVGFGLLITGFVIIGIIIKAVNFYKFYKILQNRKKKRRRLAERLSSLSFPNPQAVHHRAKPSNKITDPEIKIPAGTKNPIRLNRLSKINFINRPVVHNLDLNNSSNQIIETSFQNQGESSFSLIQPKNTLTVKQLKTTMDIKKTYSTGENKLIRQLVQDGDYKFKLKVIPNLIRIAS